MVFKVLFEATSLTTTRSSQRLVHVYEGSIFVKNKQNEDNLIKIEGRFDCYTPQIEPDELYEFIDKTNPDSLPYSVAGKNISNCTLFISRPYRHWD